MAKKKYIMRALSVGLSLAMCAGLVAPALAVTYDISIGNVYVQRNAIGVYSYQDAGEKRETYTSKDSEIIITQYNSETPTTNTITVGGGTVGGVTDTTITLRNVYISSKNAAAFCITSATSPPSPNHPYKIMPSSVTVELDGTNILKSGSNTSRSGLEINGESSVTICDNNKDGGTLKAEGGGPGIGGGAGDIIVEGVSKVEATGGDSAAGIGSREYGSVGDITISGSKVKATGGVNGAGIGSGNYVSTDDKTINGGITIRNSTVTATGGNYAAGIGNGYGGKAVGAITIEGDSKVTAAGASGIGASVSSGSKTGNITIGDNVTLWARTNGSMTNTRAIYPGKGITVTGNVLIASLYVYYVRAGTVFAVLDKDENPVLDEDGKPVVLDLLSSTAWNGEVSVCRYFAINLPKDGTGYILAQKDAEGNIVNYLVDGENTVLYQATKNTDGSVEPTWRENLVLKNVETKYEFKSEKGTDLPNEVNSLLEDYETGYVEVGAEVEVEGGKWVLKESGQTQEGGIVDGKLLDNVFTGTWRWEADHTHSYTSEITTQPTCKEAGVETFTCECGDSYTEPVDKLNHMEDGKSAISEVWSKDKTEHWHECSLCHAHFDTEEHSEVAVDAVTATCTERGLTAGGKCSVCDKVLVAQEATTDPDNHVDGNGVSGIPEEFTQDEEHDQHYKVCKLCGKEVSGSRGAHDWGDWKETKPATCTETGEETRTCGTCGKVEYRDIDPLNHMKDGKSAISEVWSGDETEHWHECSLCHARFDTKEHSEETVAGVTATCTGPGLTEGGKCSVCGKVLVEQETTTDPDNHADGNGVSGIPEEFAQDEEHDQHYKVCNLCGKEVSGSREAHAWGEWTETKPATYTEKGEETRTCGTCGAVEHRDIDAKDRKEYTVELDPNGGKLPEEAGNKITATVGEDAPELPTPTRPGYDFVGWMAKDPSVTPEQASEGKGSIVMTAQWDGKNYNVIVDYGYEGAPEADPISGKVGGTTPKLPENPTRPGYDFNGWVVVDEDGNETEFNPDEFDPDGENVHLKATWTARPSTPEADVSFTPVETGTEIEDIVVPLAGLFTRADAIGYLWEQGGSPEWKLSDFADVPEDHQWAVAIGWAQDMGIAVADEDGSFRPDDLVLRSVEDIELSPEGELEQFLNRYAVYAGIKLDEGEVFIELAGAWDDVIMGEEAQTIFDDFFAKLLTQAA